MNVDVTTTNSFIDEDNTILMTRMNGEDYIFTPAYLGVEVTFGDGKNLVFSLQNGNEHLNDGYPKTNDFEFYSVDDDPSVKLLLNIADGYEEDHLAELQKLYPEIKSQLDTVYISDAVKSEANLFFEKYLSKKVAQMKS